MVEMTHRVADLWIAHAVGAGSGAFLVEQMVDGYERLYRRQSAGGGTGKQN